MASGIYTALSGAVSDMRRVEMLSHNLANISTPAFKEFRMAAEAVKSDSGSDELTFVQPTPIERDVRPGPFRATGNPLDLALTEGVYLGVQDNGKTAYVGGATLIPSPDGTLTTEDGFPVLGKQDIVRLPPGTRSVTITSDGNVEADGNQIDRLRLTEFDDQQALKQGTGRTFINPGDAAGTMPTGAVQPIMVGYKEEPNISMVKGMTELIAAHRSYQITLKSIDTFSRIDKAAATKLASRV